MEGRPVFFFLYIGYNRVGKSVTGQQVGNEWRMNNPNGIIAGYDPQNRFKHLIDPKYKLSLNEKGWWAGNKERAKHGRRPIADLRNALFVADDMRGLNQSNHTMSDFMRLMEFRAEYTIDIIVIVHKPKFIIEGLSGYFTHILIFYIKARNEEFEKKVDDVDECVKAAQALKDYVREFPSILQEPEQFYDKSGNGKHRFPHIIIDTSTGKPIPQNINKEWLMNNWSVSDETSENSPKSEDI